MAIPDAVFDAVNPGYAIAGVPADYTGAVVRHTLALVTTVTTTDTVVGRRLAAAGLSPG